jgi:competence protein ComEA
LFSRRPAVAPSVEDMISSTTFAADRAELAPDEPVPDPPWAAGPAGRLVQRWVPGGPTGVQRLGARLRRRPAAVALATGLVVAAIIGVTVGLADSRPAPEAAPPLPAAVSVSSAAPAVAPSSSPAPPPSPKIVVSVVGRVADPGLITLPSGARVADAVAAAGGTPPGTDLTSLNLAQRLADGEQVYVGIPVPAQQNSTIGGDPATDSAAGAAAAGAAVSGKDGLAATGAKVDLNTASSAELQTLPGVGPATAQKILTYRSQHGPFSSTDQLQDISGIGPAKYAKVKDLVSA